MPVTVSVHQPNFLPWIKLLDKILASDVYVAYDTVQYTKSEYHGRQKIKLQNGVRWLSVPLVRSHGTTQLLQDVRIDNKQPFRPRQLRTLRQNYGRTPYFDEVYPLIEEVYRCRHEWLVDLNLALLESFCHYLRSPVRIVRANELTHHGDNTERLTDLVRAVGGDVHLTSTYGGARSYIDWQRLHAAGIGVRAQVFDHPTYEQPWGEFVPDLAAIDMLFCCGRETRDRLAARRSSVDVFAAATPPAGVLPTVS